MADSPLRKIGCPGIVTIAIKISRQNLLTDLSQSELVALAVYLLGGAHQPVDTEDVAVRANELAPGRLTWAKYPDQINLELVRVYLSDAKKGTKGALLSGSGRRGWTLTERGLEWAKRIAPTIGDLDLDRTRGEMRGGSIDENRWRRERARIQGTAAWDRWRAGERSLGKREASEVFRVDGYSVGRILEIKITRLRDLFGDDPEVGPFVAHLAHVMRQAEEDP